MMMPSDVSSDRILFRRMARSATLSVCQTFMAAPRPSRGRRPGGGGRDLPRAPLVGEDVAVLEHDDARGELGHVGRVRDERDRDPLLLGHLQDGHDGL